MNCYLFVHFREKTTPDGEQVYFALSRDGYHWETVNHGNPILWAYYGDCGSRDMTIVRDRRTGMFHIFATDLSLSYGMRTKYNHSWANITRGGSKCLSHWQSRDLLHWTEQELIPVADEQFGCVWAPDLIYDRSREDYVLHWSSTHASNDYGPGAIYYCRTKDFVHYTAPRELFRDGDARVIDSAIYEEDGVYYLFVKYESEPEHVLLLRADSITGPYTEVPAFREEMNTLQRGKYEAPTAVRLQNADGTPGPWCLYLDYYGVKGAGQGYVPFVASSLREGNFKRSDAAFCFPYGFKHGTILTITEEEYARVAAHDFADFASVPDLRF